MGGDMARQDDPADALRLSEHRYRNLFQAMAASFWELDFFPVGAMLRDLKASGVRDFPAYFAAHPEFVRAMMRATSIVDVNDESVSLFGRSDKAELMVDLEAYWPEASTHVFAESVIAAITGEPRYATETRLRTIDGREIDVLFTACFPPDTMNKGTLLVGVIDITARKRAHAELARLQAEFAHAARVSMLGELTASIAHEVNQPLAAIAANAAAGLRWLGRDEPDVAEARAITARIAADAQRAADIIARVRTMASARPLEKTALSVNGVVEEAMVFLRHEMQAQGAELTLDLAPDLPAVVGDRIQLQQVVVNLAVNALQAMAHGEGRRALTVRTRRETDGQVRVAFDDTGPGIDAAHLGSLFDSFFTTKDAGMGMGLPICRSIVEGHGGTIAAENRSDGEGARFTFTLPYAEQDA